jgi:glycine cleavage system H protein
MEGGKKMGLELKNTALQQRVNCMGKQICVNTDRFYTRNHLWVKVTPEGNLKIGITDYAQQFLKKKAALVEFMKNPTVRDSIEEDEVFCTVYGEMYPDPETLKAECMAFDVISPMAGRILEVNESVLDKPHLANTCCYDEGWMAIIKPTEDWTISDTLVRPERYVKLLTKAGKSPLRVL